METRLSALLAFLGSLEFGEFGPGVSAFAGMLELGVWEDCYVRRPVGHPHVTGFSRSDTEKIYARHNHIVRVLGQYVYPGAS